MKKMFVGLPAAALAATAAMALAAGGAFAASGNQGAGKSRGGNGAYIVQMAEMPVSAYTGGTPGLKATAPRKGQKIDPNSPDVVSYKAYLQSRHDQALASVGGGRKLYNYGYVFNGFAAEMTAEQAAKLARLPGVLAVTKDELVKRDTSSTPSFLGLSGNDGFWARTGAKGEGVIIGIIDSGIWPEHPSVSDRTGSNGNFSKDGKLGYQQIPGWNGKCEPGEAFSGSDCNQKLIGARYYNSGYGGNAATKAQFPYEFLSPRDFDGHGTHTATTAGGNADVPATGPAAAFGAISGIAPRARIAAYKVCWGNGVEGGCFNSDSVAAIDQAVADGVDVLNFSISGTSTNFLDPVEVAFLFAADAGVFVAASAGNSGPTGSTVAHPSPWLTTVAAGTHNRQLLATLTLASGSTVTGTFTGASANVAGLPATATILASSAGLPGADATAVRLCFTAADNGGTPVLDAAKVAGKVVVCDRGVTARTSKSDAVKAAGGVGMVLANTSANSLNADFHAVPTIHISHIDGAVVKAAVNADAATSSAISKSVTDLNAAAPFTASFSSRGPLLAGGGDLLKPDVIAPGQDILAGVAPPNYGGRLFDVLSGTSMSGPHVAGLGALMKELRPTWSPMAIKSALMTTGYDILDGPSTNPLVIFRQGAGHVSPLKAANPGLVYDHGFNDWLAFLCGTGQLTAAYCPGIRIDPSNLNVASIAIGDMAGQQTVKRKVTNVSGKPLTVSASLTGMTGFNVTVTPSTLSLQPGQSAAFEVSFLRTGAALNTYTGGQLTWNGGPTPVRSPIVVRPVALSAAASVSSAGAATSYPVTFGYSGAFSATARGLVPAVVTAGTVADDPTDSSCSMSSPNAVKTTLAVPAGTTLARFALFDADVNPGSDLDLCVFDSGGVQVGASGSGTSAEQVQLVNPAADTYTVVVQGWGVVGSTPFKLHSWLVGSAAAGNMAVSAPASATTGATGQINLSFSGLTPGVKYLGTVAYGGAAGLPNPTVVSVTP